MKIEFYYDFGSPNAYLVHKTLPEIAKTYAVPIISRPILLGGVFKATNNKSPMEAFANVAGKLAYEAREYFRPKNRCELLSEKALFSKIGHQNWDLHNRTYKCL